MNTDSPNATTELAGQFVESKFRYLQLASALLDANPLVAGWSRKTIELVLDYKRLGWNIVLEIASGKRSAAAAISMVAVSHGGERRELDRLEEMPPHAAN